MDTERKVSQLDSDVHEIYELLNGLSKAGNEQRGMIQRQGNRLDSLEANVAQLAEDVTEVRRGMEVVKADLGEVKRDVEVVKADLGEVKRDVGEIRDLIRSFVTGFNQTPDAMS